ncbi:transglycosylase SLT domain-containing protein [Enterococcus devriesei]
MGRAWMQNKLNGWSSLVSTFITTLTNFCNQVLNLLRSFYSAMYQTGREWLQNILNGWNSLYQTFINRVNQLGNDAINSLRSKSGGFNSAGRFLMQSLIDGINSMGGSLQTTMNGVANKMVGGIGKGVNGVIGGVNYVLKEVESSKKLGAWTVPQYAKGTGGHPQDGPALINDQEGNKYQEIVQNPDGSTFMAKGRNALVWLQKGAKVLNATMTERVLKSQQTLGSMIPRYADGVGEFDIVDFLDDENAVLKFLNSKVNYSGINEPWLDMTKSGVKLMTNAANKMIQGELEKFFTHGTFDGAMGANNVYKYLVDIAQKMMSKFPGLTITSGYRAGDPYYHGKHQALDLAYPGVVGSAKYTEAANWAFEKFAKQIAYVITNGKVRDRMGLSGTGSSGQWVTWPDNDHFDHIHLNGSMGGGDIFTGGGSGSSSSAVGYNPSAGVEQWRSLAIKALKMEGQYSAANLNAMLRQIQTESGGNPNAINNWDINAQRGDPSRGLLQTIWSTFKAYARPGYDKNIVDPLSNMLASIRYAVSRYGSLLAAYRGVGYENGGWITQDGLYRAGEKGKPEVVLPVTKPARAMELIGQAISYMVNNGSNILDSATVGLSNMASNMTLNLADLIGMDTQSIRSNFTGSANIDLQEVIRLLSVNNQLLAEIRDQDSDIYMDKEKVGKKVASTVAKEIVRRKY